MATIGLVIKPGLEKALAAAQSLRQWLEHNDHKLVADKAAAELLHLSDHLLHEEMVAVAAVVVTMGGDGTFIGVARHVEAACPILLGVNFGNLGFLTEIHPDNLLEVLGKVLAGQAKIKQRSLLRIKVLEDNKTVFSAQAVNDVVIQKGSTDRLIDLDIKVEEKDVMRLRADGLIVASPTGSTAYSLAAGGAIVYSGLEAILLTPICPHSLVARPLVLGPDQHIKIVIPEYEGHVSANVDGQISHCLKSGNVVAVEKSKSKIKVVCSPDKDYFDILRFKLNWGIANKAG